MPNDYGMYPMGEMRQKTMSDSYWQDESKLIDFVLGQLDEREEQELRERLQEDQALRQRHEAVARTFSALDLAPAPKAPEDLAQRTMDRIASVERTNALLAAQQDRTAPASSGYAFSLREVAAIAAVFLIMAGVLIPSLQMARQRSRQTLCASQMGQIGNGMHTYAINNNGSLPNTDTKTTRWLPGGTEPVTSNSAALFKLLSNQYVQSPVIFQCPAVGGRSFALSGHMTDFPRAEYISYSYQYSFGRKAPNLQQTTYDVLEDMAVLSDQTPLFHDGQFRPDEIAHAVSRNHGNGGQNVLYLQGNTRWVEDPNVGVGGDNIFLIRDVLEYQGTEQPHQSTDSFLLPAYSPEQ